MPLSHYYDLIMLFLCFGSGFICTRLSQVLDLNSVHAYVILAQPLLHFISRYIYIYKISVCGFALLPDFIYIYITFALPPDFTIYIYDFCALLGSVCSFVYM